MTPLTKGIHHLLQAVHDAFIYVPNGVGVIFSAFQLVLCFVFKQKDSHNHSPDIIPVRDQELYGEVLLEETRKRQPATSSDQVAVASFQV